MLSRELVAASTRPLLLGVLEKGENYGYAIIQAVRTLSDGDIEWSEGMLYPVLYRLERDKLIVSRWKVGESGRRRKYYRLTTKGVRAVSKEKEQWVSVNDTLHRLWGASTCPT